MRRTAWHLFVILLWAGCVLCQSAAASDAPKRPNIVWLIGENLGHELGCYGERLVQSPNIDRLAAEGLRYTRVFATNPACAPSRSAFFTGMYQTSTGTHHMRSHRNDDFRLPAGVRPITHRLRDAGYFTANVKTIGERSVGTGKLDLNFVNEGPIYESDDWEALKSHQPFFAVVNSHENEYDIYDRKSHEKPRVPWVGEGEHPQIATPENVTPPPYYPDHPTVRQEWARYLNSISGMDRRIGWVLDRLRQDGLEEDTVVMFFGDNGRLEARGIHWCYDSGLLVPLVVRWPRNFPSPPQIVPGGKNDEIVSLLDVTATTLAIADVPLPPAIQGRNLLGANAAPPRDLAFGARDRIDETVQRIRTVRDKRWRYIRNYTPGPTIASLNRYKEKCFPVLPLMRELQSQGKLTGAPAELMTRRGPSEELYDLQADPHEIKNLVDLPQPETRAALMRLRAALDAWIVETNDQGAVPEPPEVVAPFAKEMHDWFGTPPFAIEAAARNSQLSLAAILEHKDALAGAHDVEVRSGFAYVAGKRGALAVVDVRDPAKPVLAWHVRDEKHYEDAETVLPLEGDRLLVGTRDLFLFDIADRVRLKQVATIADRPRVDLINGFARSGPRVYAANKSGRIAVIDLELPNALRLAGVRETRPDGLLSPHDVALCGELLVTVDAAYFGNGAQPGRIAAYRVTQPDGKPLPPDRWTLLGKLTDARLAGANRVHTRGAVVWAASSLRPTAPRTMLTQNVSAVDLSEPTSPKLRGSLAFPDFRGPNGLELSGSVLFAAGGQTVVAIDVSNPDAPRELASFTSPEAFPGGADDAHDLVCRDGHLFVTAQNSNRLVVLKLGDELCRHAE